jgi:hypothetical protein
VIGSDEDPVAFFEGDSGSGITSIVVARAGDADATESSASTATAASVLPECRV